MSLTLQMRERVSVAGVNDLSGTIRQTGGKTWTGSRPPDAELRAPLLLITPACESSCPLEHTLR